MSYAISDGWFSKVNGLTVLHHSLPSSLMAHAGHFNAHHGIEFHVQGGSGRDIWQVEVDRGYPIATFNVDDTGQIRQYNDARIADWHGDSVSEYAFGVEHTGDGVHALLPKQLDASAALFAALVEWTEHHFGETIPLRKVGSIDLANYRTAKGFWDHIDVQRGPLNENGHVDHLIGRSWVEQIEAIHSFLVATPTPAPPFTRLLKVGVNAAEVVTWKKRMATKGLFKLSQENDGPGYGKVIEQATVEFQRRKNLAQDGIVGPKTWDAAWS